MKLTTKFHKTLTDKELKAKSVRRKSIDSYCIEWGADNTFSWMCSAEDKKLDIEEHTEQVIGIFPLINQKQSTYFVSIGLDHKIGVYRCQDGRLIRTLQGHEKRIIGLIELVDGNVLSVSLDGTLRVWDPISGKCKAVIEEAIESVDDIIFSKNHDDFVTRCKTGSKIWDLKGNLLLNLPGLNNRLESLRGLEAGCWLTKAENERPVLWTEGAKSRHRFPFDFNLVDDLLQLTNKQFLIKSPGNGVTLWTEDGKCIEQHLNDKDVIGIFEVLVVADEKTKAWMQKYKTVDDYPHVRNEYEFEEHRIVSAAKEIKALDLNFKAKPEKKIIWDFFNRPVEREIKTTLKAQIDAARQSEKDLKEKITLAETSIEKHKRKRSFGKASSVVMFILASIIGCLGIVAFMEPKYMQVFVDLASQIEPKIGRANQADLPLFFAVPCGFLLILGFMFFIRNRSQKSKQLKRTSNLNLLNTMLSAYYDLIDKIKMYRDDISSKIPQEVTPEQVNKIINKKIHGDIQQTALDECGIEMEDIKYATNKQESGQQRATENGSPKVDSPEDNGKAIVLQDWSYIQKGDKRLTSRFIKENEYSLREGVGHEFIFAVRYIQFIFLTTEKIDVFTTYYDFIADRYIAKESNAFYYRDVTNISKKEVTRTSPAGELTATEILFSISSGEKISLTIMNEDSIRGIAKSGEELNSDEGQDEEVSADSLAEILSQLTTEERKTNEHFDREIDSISEQEQTNQVFVLKEIRKSLLDYLNKEREMASNYNQAGFDSSMQQADAAISLIRKQIRSFKATTPIKSESLV